LHGTNAGIMRHFAVRKVLGVIERNGAGFAPYGRGVKDRPQRGA